MVTTGLAPKEVRKKAMVQLGAGDYSLISQSEDMLVFEGGKDISMGWMILGLLFLLIGAIIYYLLAKNHKIIVNINELETGSNVECISNTSKSRKDADGFLNSLGE